MSRTILKILDLDLQGQIGIETYKFCVIPCECNNFELLGILPLSLSYVFDQRTWTWTFSKTGDLDLDLQGQIGLQTCKIFVLNL